MRISYLFYTKRGVRKSLSVQNAVLHQAQQVAVKSFSVFYSGCSQACVWCVEMVGLSVAATAGSTVVALIMQVLQVLGGVGEKGGFSLPGSSGPEGQHVQAQEKADWLHILSVFAPVWTSSSSFPSIEGRDFPSEPNLSVEHHGGWRISFFFL